MKPAGTMYITKKSTIVQTTLDLDTYVPGQQVKAPDKSIAIFIMLLSKPFKVLLKVVR